MKYLKPVELYHKSLKITGPLMGLNIGNTQLGLSISDASKEYASPRSARTVVRTKNPASNLQTLQTLISTYSVLGIVIGYPFERERDKKNRFPTIGVQAKKFIEDLNKTREFEDLYYTLWDNALTTKMLVRCLKEISKPCKFIPMVNHTVKDEYAAFEILEEYFHIFSQNKDQSSNPRVLSSQIKMKPSAKGE